MSNYGFTSAGTSYDDEDRLTGFARASGTFTQSWSLTSVGDWNSITTNGTAQNRTHGPTHELLTAGGQNVTTDVKGNITLLPTTLTTSGVAMAVGYDFDNKLKSADVDNNGSNDVTFQYDALGRRVARQGTSGSFVYVQHDQQTIADYGYGDAPSSPTHRYVCASYIDEPVVRKAAGTSGTIYYYHRNQQYSITAVTTSSGSVAERYAYTAYGQPTILDGSGSVLSSSAINNRYTYTGREWDQTLGLYHFRARWMSGLAGRFMGRDPIGFEGSEWGLYEFLRARSLGYLDPSGKFQVSVGDPNPVGAAPQPPLQASSAECAAKRTKCSELRDLWSQAGKTMVVAWFDKWLSKSGCPNPTPVNIDSVSPGATASIAANPLFLSGLANAFGCGGCVFGQPFSGQLLPTLNVVDLPGTNPLTGLNDIEYLVGSIRGVTAGCLSKTGCSRNQIGRAGGEPVYQECCNYQGTVIFSINDSFHFPGGWRNFNLPNPLMTNSFAEYNEACSYLETNCGYCSQPWTSNGTATVNKTCCKQCL